MYEKKRSYWVGDGCTPIIYSDRSEYGIGALRRLNPITVTYRFVRFVCDRSDRIRSIVESHLLDSSVRVSRFGTNMNPCGNVECHSGRREEDADLRRGVVCGY